MDNVNKSNNSKLFKISLTILLCVSIILSIFVIIFSMNTLNEIRSIKDCISSTYSNIESKLYSSVGQIEDILNKESSFISDYNYEIVDYDKKEVQLKLNVQPKTYTLDENLYFSYSTKDSEPKIVQAIPTTTARFSAVIYVPISQDINVSLIIDNGNSKKIENLNNIPSPINYITSNLTPSSLGGSFSYNKSGKLSIKNFQIQLAVSGSITSDKLYSDFQLKSANVQLDVNGSTVDRIPMSLNNTSENNESLYLLKLKNYNIYCNPNDTINISIIALDNKGVRYRSTVESVKISDDGSLDFPVFDFTKIDVY